MTSHPGRAALLLGALSLGGAPAAAQVPDSMMVLRNDENGLVFFVRKDGGLASRGDDFVGPIPMEGTGTRLMWYPGKGAFRAGRVNGTQWNDSNVGMYSVALGFNSRASGDNTFAAGPGSTASQGSAVAIGENNTANSYASVALGYHAHSNQKPGSFVFGDFSTPDSIRSGANNQATFRVAGGFRIFTNANLLSGVTIAANGSSWDVVSDRRRKENFLPLDGEDLLRRLRGVPVTSWNYVAQGRQVRHVGPMAQDWHRAFGLSGDSLTINSGDFDGVNLAAVQALERRTAEQGARIQALERENADLRRAAESQRAELEARVARLEALLGAPAAPPGRQE
ncbi:MAG TPA: tail fiber domain-containing protein [Longimicrobiaceae bacterium]|nr:tail fiber domain-containing protein [Longimicrobiaceae bacterium]